ncbi:hypothetical protein CA13_73040 [Planctomycetes bacterium CA13]|uniref:Uncharacterized protein n=2 Tax=Novipirellula herctigrandis TaxID=2527986 RepID=A0A5C5YPI1_9BACT|nr:hypothetical protein CA13_73040 [Planctomycetes bacterium CA13]
MTLHLVKCSTAFCFILNTLMHIHVATAKEIPNKEFRTAISKAIGELDSTGSIEHSTMGLLSSFSPSKPNGISPQRFVASWNVSKDDEFVVQSLVAPAIFLPQFGNPGNWESSASHQEAARVLTMRYLSDEFFRRRYLQLVLWSRLLIPDSDHRLYSQSSAIGLTLTNMQQRVGRQSNPFFWQDCLEFCLIREVFGLPVSFGFTFTKDTLRRELDSLMLILRTRKFVLSEEGNAWKTSTPVREDAVEFELPDLKLPEVPTIGFDQASKATSVELLFLLHLYTPDALSLGDRMRLQVDSRAKPAR